MPTLQPSFNPGIALGPPAPPDHPPSNRLLLATRSTFKPRQMRCNAASQSRRRISSQLPLKFHEDRMAGSPRTVKVYSTLTMAMCMRNRTVLRRTRTRHLAARPSRTLDLDLGVTVKHSFLLLFQRHFNFGHLGLLGALGLLITFPILG